MEEKRIPCPYCRELIVQGAQKCRFCGERLTGVRSLPGETVSVGHKVESQVTIGGVILNSPVFVSGLLALVALVAVLFFRWITVHSDKYDSLQLARHIFLLAAGKQDAPWYLSIAMIGLFLFPTFGALIPGVLYCTARTQNTISARFVDLWSSRVAGVGIGAAVFFAIWLTIGDAVARGADSVKVVPGIAYYLTTAVCLLLALYAHARFSCTRLYPANEPEVGRMERLNIPWHLLAAVALVALALPRLAYGVCVAAIISWFCVVLADAQLIGGRSRFPKLVSWLRSRDVTLALVTLAIVTIALLIGHSKRVERHFLRSIIPERVARLRPGITKSDVKVMIGAKGFDSGYDPKSGMYEWEYKWGEYSYPYKGSKKTELDLSVIFDEKGNLAGLGGSVDKISSAVQFFLWEHTAPGIFLAAALLLAWFHTHKQRRKGPNGIGWHVIVCVTFVAILSSWGLAATQRHGSRTVGKLSLRGSVILDEDDALRWHMDHGQDVDQKLEGGGTLLGLAVREGHPKIVRVLLQYKANPNLQDNAGCSPLWEAAARKNLNIATLLLDHGANPNLQNNDGCGALWAALAGKNLDIAALLLERGANPNVLNRRGEGLLHSQTRDFEEFHNGAYFTFDDDGVRFLVAHGVDVNLRDREGQTPLIAVILGCDKRYDDRDRLIGSLQEFRNSMPKYAEGLVKLLLAKGANAGLQDNRGRTPLHYAVASWHLPSTVELLLKAGVDPRAVDKDGCTPLQLLQREISTTRNAEGKKRYNRDAKEHLLSQY